MTAKLLFRFFVLTASGLTLALDAFSLVGEARSLLTFFGRSDMEGPGASGVTRLGAGPGAMPFALKNSLNQGYQVRRLLARHPRLVSPYQSMRS